MLKRFIHIAIILFCAVTILPAQNPYLPGNLSGGTGVPGTKTRSPLNSMERAANNLAGATILTDTFGNQRFSRFVYISDTCLASAPPATGNTDNLNSFIKICGTDSTYYIDWTGGAVFTGGGGGGVAQNWYTVDGTTTDATRTALILESAEWYGLSPDGYMNFGMGGIGGTTAANLYLDATLIQYFYQDATGNEVATFNTNGIVFETSAAATKSIGMYTDTINWVGSFDPTNLRINYVSDATYMYADSLKVVALGQFPGFPSTTGDGTTKGILYSPSSGGITFLNGSGIDGSTSQLNLSNNSIFYSGQNDGNGNENIIMQGNTTNETSYFEFDISSNDSPFGGGTMYFSEGIPSNNKNLFSVYYVQKDTNAPISLYFGENTSSDPAYYFGSRAFGTRIYYGEEQIPFDWLQTYLPNDTTGIQVSMYNRKYYFPNDTPFVAVGDTSLIYWAGDGTTGGKHPGFMTLDDVCNHCAGSVVNWYNSNGTTTDNTRIATVTETATWFSTDGQADGVYPFRFELEDGAPNEPEMMVWKFPADSLTLSQSDVEIIFHSNTDLNSWADGVYSMRADSGYFTSNSGVIGTNWKVTDYQIQNNAQRITQTISTNTKQDVLETVTITGTAQTELTMPTTGSVLNLPTNTVGNFEIHLVAVCTVVGNGAGISVGETYGSWSLGAIKNIAGTTALVGSVQAPATAQSDTGMSTSVVTIDANDTNDSLRIRFTPPATAGTTTVIKVTATIDFTETSY